ncbi:MAG: inhibitor of KinA [Flavobacteriales bacterium]|jgi:inhibitor of KinA
MSAFTNVEIFPLGDQAILIRWEQLPSDALLEHLLTQKTKIIAALDIEVVHAYNELLLKVAPGKVSEGLIRKLLNEEVELLVSKRMHYEIPVCYGGDFGKDLNAFAKAKQLTPEAVIELHTKEGYRLYFMGFLPGFLYLEGLDERLYFPRKVTPSLHMTAGSVAIGGTQTGIYPQASPGGWHSIGRTPISLFDPSDEIPSPFKAGDVIQFKAIHADVFTQIASEVKRGTYRLKTTPIDV